MEPENSKRTEFSLSGHLIQNFQMMTEQVIENYLPFSHLHNFAFLFCVNKLIWILSPSLSLLLLLLLFYKVWLSLEG